MIHPIHTLRSQIELNHNFFWKVWVRGYITSHRYSYAGLIFRRRGRGPSETLCLSLRRYRVWIRKWHWLHSCVSGVTRRVSGFFNQVYIFLFTLFLYFILTFIFIFYLQNLCRQIGFGWDRSFPSYDGNDDILILNTDRRVIPLRTHAFLFPRILYQDLFDHVTRGER